MPDHRLRLIAAVSAVLNGPVLLGPKELHYLESTCGDAGEKTVARMFSEDMDDEQQVFAQLVLFPDESLQQRLEPLLSTAAWEVSDRDAVIDALTDHPINTVLYSADREIRLSVLIPAEAVRQFVRRLNIEKNIAPEIAKTLNRFISDPDEISRIRVMVRNARAVLTGPALGFFCRCIEKLHTDERYFDHALRLILSLLEYPALGGDFYAMFSAQKDRCLKMLGEARKTGWALAHQNMETLMLKGMRVGAVNTGEVSQQIELIDHICLSVFGRVPHLADPRGAPVDVNNSGESKAMDRIFRLLS